MHIVRTMIFQPVADLAKKKTPFKSLSIAIVTRHSDLKTEAELSIQQYNSRWLFIKAPFQLHIYI